MNIQIVGESQLLADGEYADFGAVNLPNGVRFVNTDSVAVAVNAEVDNNDSFLPLATLPAANVAGVGTVLAPGSTVTIIINTASAGQADGGNLIASVDGGNVYITPVKV
jgi:hypothetical protein